MKKIFLFLAAMTFALLTLPALAETTQQQVTIDRLRAELARTKSQKRLSNNQS